MTVTEQQKIVAVLDLRDISPGIPWSRCLEILQESIETTTFQSESGDLTFTVAVEGFGELNRRDC